MWRHLTRATRFHRAEMSDTVNLASQPPASTSTRRGWIAASIVIVGLVAATAPRLVSRAPPRHENPTSIGPSVRMPGAPATSAFGLKERIGDMERRLRDQPNDLGAAVLLKDALLRPAPAI